MAVRGIVGLNGMPIRSGKSKVRPTDTVGAMGTALYGGVIQEPDDDAALRGESKYKTYSEILANVSIVAAGVRYFLNLIANASWAFNQAEADVDSKFADLAESILTDDPRTPWHRIVRRAAMYRFYGFSLQEWTAIRRVDGVITFLDVAPRAQRTIERWDVSDDGDVIAVWQRSPQTQAELYIPRSKCLYMVDDTLSDSPDGLGIFRHLAAPSARIKDYERLEGVGFETDLRGVPVGRGPFTELARMVQSGELTKADRERIESPMRNFIKNHIKGPKLGILLDSQPYISEDEAARPSSTPQWDLQLLKAGATSLPDLANSISRVNREIARVLGVEQLLLGDGSTGSFALSHDKTQSFFMLVDGALREIAETVEGDLLGSAWAMNGWPPEMMPSLSTDAVRFQDVEVISSVLRDMATAGAVLDPDDPAIDEVRDLLGISHTETGESMAIDAGLVPAQGRQSEPEVKV